MSLDDQRPPGPRRAVMLLENYPYPADVRVSREARALVAAGHQVTVIAPRGPGQSRRDVVDGVKVKRFRVPQLGDSARATLLEYLVATFALYLGATVELLRGATILHLHNPPDTLFGAGLIARVLKRKVIFDHHDLFPELVQVRIGAGPWFRGALLLERATFAVAHRVLAANESHARIARERGAVPPERVTVVRNGPPADTIVDKIQLRSGLLTDPHLVYLGLLASQDGGMALPDLMVALAQNHGLAEARLTVIGDGDERADIEAAFARHGLGDRARVTGWVTHAEARQLVAEADICIDPAPPTTLNRHSTMMKIAEYMAAGKPIVAFDLDETRWTAREAVAIATDAGIDALAQVISDLSRDGERRLAMARQGLARVPSLTWEHSVQALLRTYASL